MARGAIAEGGGPHNRLEESVRLPRGQCRKQDGVLSTYMLTSTWTVTFHGTDGTVSPTPGEVLRCRDGADGGLRMNWARRICWASRRCSAASPQYVTASCW